MNNLEFKTLRNKLNLSHKTLSRLTNEPSIKIVKGWDLNQTIPPHVITFITDMASIFKQMIQTSIQAMSESIKRYNVNLIRYKNDHDFEFADAKLFKILLTNEIHIALLRELFNEAKKLNIFFGVIDFNKKSYLFWLNKKGYCHCDKHRSEWVSSIKFTVSLGQKELMEEMLKNLRKDVLALKKIPLSSKKFSPEEFMVAKIETFQKAILFCILELYEGAISSFKRQKFILSAVSTRALFERMLILFYLYQNLEEMIKKDDIETPKERIQKIMFGSKGDFKMIDNINILTMLEKLIKKALPGSKTQELYDQLSNLVHPNFNGLFDAYITLDIDNSGFSLSSHDKGNLGLTILTGLYLGIDLTKMYYEKLTFFLENQSSILLEKYKSNSNTLPLS